MSDGATNLNTDQRPEIPLMDATSDCGCGGDHADPSSDTSQELPAVVAPAADGSPVLDVRNVPHSIRHATVFGAVDSIRAGHSLVLVAPHDPLPLLKQISERHDGAFAVSYEVSGPTAWRLRLTRS